MRENTENKTYINNRQLRLKKIFRRTVIALIAFLFVYCFLIAFPYAGPLRISDELRDSFNMDNFFGEEHIPEQVMILEDARESFYHRLNIIDRAQEEIFFVTFITHDGLSEDVFFAALLKAADRGVRVNLILDGRAGVPDGRIINAAQTHPNVYYFVFNPINLFRPHYINYSLHDKFLIVDNTYMITGGRNMGDRYFDIEGWGRNYFHDRDVLVYNTDPSTYGSIRESVEYCYRLMNIHYAQLRRQTSNRQIRRGREAKYELFAIYEDFIRGKPYIFDFDYSELTIPVYNITLLANPIYGTKKEPVIAFNFFMMAMNSNRIIMQSPYFIFTNRNLEYVRQVANHADEFVLFTDSKATNDYGFGFVGYRANRRNLVRTGLTIYERQYVDNHSFHHKTYLFGDRLTAIGSFNMDERSARISTETMLVIDSPEIFDIVYAYITANREISLQVGFDNRLILCGTIEPAHVSWGKRAYYHMMGFLLKPFRFLL